MNFQAVIFDLFGTLVDFSDFGDYQSVMNKMADILGIHEPEFSRLWEESHVERFTGVFKNTQENIIHAYRELGLQPDEDKARDAAAVRLAFTKSSLFPKPDVSDTVEKLRSLGMKIGLISDCSSEVPLLWADSPMAGLIDEPVFSCSAGLKKPDPRIYELACSLLGVKASDCLYVGDGGSDELTGAREVGMYAVLVDDVREREYTASRFNRQTWDGDRITAIAQVLEYF